MNFFKRFNTLLQGQPDSIVTSLLLILSMVGFIVALSGNPALKVLVTTYYILP